MPSYIGNTSDSFYGINVNEGVTLASFTLVNNTNVAVTAQLAIKREGIDYDIIPRNTVINVYEMYVSDTPRQMNGGDSVALLVTGSTDYMFSITKPQ